MQKESKLEELAAQKMRIEIENMRREHEFSSHRFLRLTAAATAIIITLVAGFWTYYVQLRKRGEIESLLEKEISLKTIEFRKEIENAKDQINQLLNDIRNQQKTIAAIKLPPNSDPSQIIGNVLNKVNAQLAKLEDDIVEIKNSKIIEKVAKIEGAIEGEVSKILSVPLIRNDFKNFKSITEKELLKIEKSIEKLDSRISFFATTTITLALAIFTAIIAPLVMSFFQRRVSRNTREVVLENSNQSRG
jgi:hypothetical protein